jgi:hypothetical protein
VHRARVVRTHKPKRKPKPTPTPKLAPAPVVTHARASSVVAPQSGGGSSNWLFELYLVSIALALLVAAGVMVPLAMPPRIAALIGDRRADIAFSSLAIAFSLAVAAVVSGAA